MRGFGGFRPDNVLVEVGLEVWLELGFGGIGGKGHGGDGGWVSSREQLFRHVVGGEDPPTKVKVVCVACRGRREASSWG